MSESSSMPAVPHAAAEAVSEPQSEPQSRRIVGLLMTALVVCFLVVGGVVATKLTTLPAAFWPAGGVAAAAWLRGPKSLNFNLAYGALLTFVFAIGNYIAGRSETEALVFAAGNMLDIVCVVWLARTFAPRLDFSSLRGLGRYLLVGPVISPVLASLFVGAMAVTLNRNAFAVTAGYWWLSHAISFAVVTPFCLTLTKARLAALAKPTRLVEAVLVFGLIAATSVYAFSDYAEPVQFLVIPLILAAAVRMRVLGASAAVLVAICGAVWGLTLDISDGSAATASARLNLVQNLELWVLFGFLPALPVAALLDERDALAEEARAGQLRAEAASAGKSRLLANVAHEIKSPAAGIIGIGEMMAGGKLGPVSETQVEMSQVVTDTARQIERLAYDLLDVAQAEAGALQLDIRPVPLVGLAEDVQRTMTAKPDAAKMTWRIDGRDQAVIALGDSLRIAQVLTHLTSNAVKYGASGGRVTIRLSRPSDETVRLEVIDAGPGIPPQRQSELFEPFNRLGMEKSTIEGHGIGLALVKRLVELMGGQVGFDSPPGRGARFWADLPAAPGTVS